MKFGASKAVCVGKFVAPKVGWVGCKAVKVINFVRPKAFGILGSIPYGILGAMWAVNAANRKLYRAQRQLVASTVSICAVY